MTTSQGLRAQQGAAWLANWNPLRSVRSAVIAGFGLLVLILIAVVAGSAWLVRDYQANTALMEEKADTALLLQGAESYVGTAGLMLQRYAVDGDPGWLPEILAGAEGATRNLDVVRAREQNANDTEDLARLDAIDVQGDGLRTGLEQVVLVRAGGDTAVAMTTLDTMVEPFRRFQADLRAAAEDELAEVAAVQSDVRRTGNLAFWLLVISGITGITVGAAVSALIARSIVRPLSSLEATAMTASTGDMTVRSQASGPRELTRVGEAMNHMMATVQERTEEIRLSNEELRERNRQLLEARAQAASDPLTGLLNHRKFHQRVQEMVAEAEESGEFVGLIMLDVDNFKQVNDKLGHLKGDDVLRDLASTIAEVAGQDNGYRYGGDEFSILLPGSDHEKTGQMAKRVLDAVAKCMVEENVTVSLGVAAYPEMAANAQELVYRADMALSWAKSSGKNQVGDWHALIGRKVDTKVHSRAPAAVDSGSTES
jgi:diguanylate cyclase (GGDEF)-like protein